ncbi:MAG: barstar family protein [Clostridia bacterium]|nr:barstar family protein [Clostridia bacterium]
MDEYILNGKKMKTYDDAYDHMAGVLEFPDYFGRNLDALYDLLTERAISVVLRNVDDMLNALGSYGCDMLKCFFDAAEENENFTFTVK